MLVLDQFQIDAVSDIKSNNNVLVVAPTGSGKTLIAEKSIEYYLKKNKNIFYTCLLYTSPSPRDRQKSRMPSSA